MKRKNLALTGLLLAGTRPGELEGPDPSTQTIVWIVAAIVVFGAVAWLLRRRPPGRPGGRALEEEPPAQGHEELMEVGERLTAAAASGDIERAVVREAIVLVRANAAALVRRAGDRWIVAHESSPQLLREKGLADGVIGRVAATGQPVVEVSASDAAIRLLPVSLIAIPLGGEEPVDAILVMVRGTATQFTAHEQDRLVALAPMAAAALQSAHEAAHRALVDPLTGLGNRARLDADLSRVLGASEGEPTALMVLELDHFRAVTQGRDQAGDDLLRGVGAILRDTVRPADAVYRYGGEEFCIVLPQTDVATAAAVGERIRAAIAATLFESAGLAEPLRITASIGVASAHGAEQRALVAAAESALYQAKGAGRDRVVVAP